MFFKLICLFFILRYLKKAVQDLFWNNLNKNIISFSIRFVCSLNYFLIFMISKKKMKLIIKVIFFYHLKQYTPYFVFGYWNFSNWIHLQKTAIIFKCTNIIQYLIIACQINIYARMCVCNPRFWFILLFFYFLH